MIGEERPDDGRRAQLLKGVAELALLSLLGEGPQYGLEILERLRRGEKVALVTDAGTPGISDPGERVVSAALAAGLRAELYSTWEDFVDVPERYGLPRE